MIRGIRRVELESDSSILNLIFGTIKIFEFGIKFQFQIVQFQNLNFILKAQKIGIANGHKIR